MIKGVIFDLDGTLVDSLQDIARNANIVLSDLGYPIHALEAYRHFVGDGARILMKNALPAHIDEVELDAALAQFKLVYEQNLHAHTKAYEGIDEMLNLLACRGLHLGILSNKPHAFTVLYAQNIFADAAFSQVHGQKDHVPHKPHPAGALAIAQAWGVAPHEVVFVGDTATDIRTAKNAGMRAVGVLWGFRTAQELKDAGAEHLISHPGELAQIVADEV
jgi:phosphoglycolate phosphatase